MFQIIRPDTHIDFLAGVRWAIVVSGIVLVAGLASLVVRGPRYGIDFAGGTLVHVRFPERVAIDELRKALTGTVEGDFTVQDFGNERDEYLVRMPEADPELEKGLSAQVQAALANRFGDQGAFEILRIENVGPRVGEDLRRRGILAVVAATAMMALYIAFRFELRFGVGAVAALIHDSVITVGALSLAGFEFDLTIVAALLTVIGYSVNDTVVVSDRIRENLKKYRREPLAALINRSINETLSRTLMTTGTTLLVIGALFFLGGEVIHGFAFTLLVGLIVGIWSTIYISSPIVLYLPRATRPS